MFQLTGSSQYDIAKYYTNGTDSKGHYEQMRFKMTPNMEAMIADVVGAVPEYKTREDFVRDAMLHRVMYIQTGLANGTLVVDEALIKRELHKAEMERYRQAIESMGEYVKSCMDTIDMMVNSKDWPRLDELLCEMTARADDGSFPPDPLQQLNDAIDYGWTTMRTEVTRKALRRQQAD